MTITQIPGYSIGPDVYDSIFEICGVYGKRAVMIGGKRGLAVAGDRILTALRDTGVSVTHCLWYGGEASLENVEALLPKCTGSDMVFAVGGGKAIDTAKVLAQRAGLPFFTFPTIASTCAATSGLAALCHPGGTFREYFFSKAPPVHAFIDTRIIAEAPDRYLLAGIGHGMDGHCVCTESSLGEAATAHRWGAQALEDCKTRRVTEALTEVVRSIVVSTRLGSQFAQTEEPPGIAHAVYNGFTALKSAQQHYHLYGEVAAYGSLVQLTVDRQYEERDRLFAFHRSVGLPVRLAELHIVPEELPMLAQKALMGIDAGWYPYPVTAAMVLDGMMELEEWAALGESGGRVYGA